MKNTLLIKIVVILLVLSTTTFAQKPPIIEFEQTPCFGSCAVFQLKIFNNRRVTLHAIKYMKEGEGNLVSRLKRKKYKNLIKFFNENEFFKLKDEYTSRVTDLPTRYITINYEGQSKRILDYTDAPTQLKEIEKELFSLISTTSWKKSD